MSIKDFFVIGNFFVKFFIYDRKIGSSDSVIYTLHLSSSLCDKLLRDSLNVNFSCFIINNTKLIHLIVQEYLK